MLGEIYETQVLGVSDFFFFMGAGEGEKNGSLEWHT